MTTPTTVKYFYKLYTENIETKSLFLQFGRCLLELKTNSSELIDKLRGYYKEFVIETGKPDIVVYAIQEKVHYLGLNFEPKLPDKGKKKIKEEFTDLTDGRIVRKRFTGMYFFFGKEMNLALGDAVANDNQVINFLNNRYIEWLLKKEYLLGHCSAVTAHGRGLAMAGFSGMGKSTLSLHMMNLGASFVSNDRLLVKKNSEGYLMEGVAKLPRINPGTILNNPSLKCVMPAEEKKRYEHLSTQELWGVEAKYDVFIDECFGKNRYTLSAPMNAAVILNWKHNNLETTYEVTSFRENPELLEPFMKPVGLFFSEEEGENIIEKSVDDYLAEIGDCPVLSVKGGVNFEQTAEKCMAFMKRGRFS